MKALLAVGVLAMLLVGCSARAWEAGCDVPQLEDSNDYWAEAVRAAEADPDGDEWRCILLASWRDVDWDGEWQEMMEVMSHIDRRKATRLRVLVEDTFPRMIDASDWPAALEIRDEFVDRLMEMAWGDLDINDEEDVIE